MPMMHIGDLDNISNNPNGPTWNARVRVTIHDANHVAVANATVTATVTFGASSTTVSCITGGGGECQLVLQIGDDTTPATFTVTNVTHATFTYDSNANHDVDILDSNGTMITVA